MKSLLKNKKVASVEGDANYDEIFIDLTPGYCFEEDGVHCLGAETVKEAMASLKLVRKCNCPECKQDEMDKRKIIRCPFCGTDFYDNGESFVCNCGEPLGKDRVED